MYLHTRMNEQREEAKNIISSLFELYKNDINLLPKWWINKINCENSKIEIIGDYIAGMTDRYAIKIAQEHGWNVEKVNNGG